MAQDGHTPAYSRVPRAAAKCEFLALNSRVSQSRVKGLFREEIHTIDRVWAISEGKRAQKYGVVTFYGLGNFIGYRVGGLF